MTEVSGLAVQTLPMFLRDKYGDEAYRRWFDSLPPDSRNIYEKPIAIKEWYILDDSYLEPMKKMCTMFYNGKERGAWEVGRHSADYALKGILKVFIKLGSVNSFIKRAAAVISNYYKPGTIEVMENKKGRAVLRLTGFTEIHQLLENRIAGWMERALEISGCKMRLVTVSRSRTYTDFKINWK
jgi:hypothetical protein